MANGSYMQNPGNAWSSQVYTTKDKRRGESFNSHGQADDVRDKYFNLTDEGEYQLKDGYEQRHIGMGDRRGDLLGAEMSYTNVVDDDDDQDPSQRNNYGIYKKETPKSTPAANAKPPKPTTPEPQKDKGPIEYSPEVSRAKERVNKYQSLIDGNQGSTFGAANAPSEPQKDPQAQADKYKLNLMNKGLTL